jgi:SAM-dependent methyltransferase
MAEKHFFEQEKHAISYLIPFFKRALPDIKNLMVLEVGCAEAGLIKQLHTLDIKVVGLEIEESRVQIAHRYVPRAMVFSGDISDPKIAQKLDATYDLIVMRDVIEHIPQRDQTFANLHQLLKPNGYLYITFPPKFSGFAGHQQHAHSFLKLTPYLHVLPAFVLRFLGHLLKERPQLIENIISNYKNGLTIRRFEKYCAQSDYTARIIPFPANLQSTLRFADYKISQYSASS